MSTRENIRLIARTPYHREYLIQAYCQKNVGPEKVVRN